MFDLTYNDAIAKAEHLIALGDTTVYLRDETDFPFDKVTKVEAGSSYRLSGPSSCYLYANEAGLSFKLSVEFEGRDANGRGVSMFDRAKLRELAIRLSPVGREALAGLLEREVLSGLTARTNEIRAAMQSQADSEDCVRGLIAFAREQTA